MTHALSAKARQVRDYYDANTARFELLGQGRRAGAIHRAVWTDEVRSRDAAFDTVNELVRRESAWLAAELGEPLHLLDLGCGVGASLIYLAARTPFTGTGVTLSGVQATRGRERARSAGVGDRIEVLQADFHALPDDLRAAHLAYAIEAFVHAADPAAFFASAARHVTPRGLLVVCDDFLSTEDSASSAADRRTLNRVREGWLASSLMTLNAATAHAQRAGFSLLKNIDLTPYLELDRPRDRVIRLLVQLGRILPVSEHALGSLAGGSALQSALRSRLIEFRFVVWRRG